MVLCFGEILLRFAPDAGGIWLDQSVLDVYTAGSELNVASALAKWKVPVCYLTALPDNFLSKELIKKIFAEFNKKNLGLFDQYLLLM